MKKLKEGDTIKITGINCGHLCKKKFLTLGIFEGKELDIVTIQPLHGPITIAFGHSKNDTFTIGSGMIEKLEYEVM